MSELFGAVLARGGAAEATSDRAWVQAMLDAESALARARAAVEQIPAAHADAIAAACRAEDYDIAELGEAAARGGNPAAPLAKALTARVAASDEAAAGEVHRGFTSQDVMDTALMLIVRRAVPPVLADLRACADECAALAAEHRDAPIAGRTLMQQAVPTTFGLKAAGWGAGLDAAVARLAAVRPSAQLGGAAGTLASLGDRALDVAARFAAELGLEAPVLPWHTSRGRIAGLAAALGEACAAVAKVAGDVVLLSQTEVGEVREGTGGTSSAMPHKHNPVAAVAALAGARQAPGLVATLLATAGDHEHERAAGAWHAEWAPLRALLVAGGSAAAWLRECLEGLEVDTRRMRENIDPLVLAERVATALADELGRERANALVAEAARSGRFPDALRSHLPGEELDRLLDPAGATGSAGALVDRYLAGR